MSKPNERIIKIKTKNLDKTSKQAATNILKVLLNIIDTNIKKAVDTNLQGLSEEDKTKIISCVKKTLVKSISDSLKDKLIAISTTLTHFLGSLFDRYKSMKYLEKNLNMDINKTDSFKSFIAQINLILDMFKTQSFELAETFYTLTINDRSDKLYTTIINCIKFGEYQLTSKKEIILNRLKRRFFGTKVEVKRDEKGEFYFLPDDERLALETKTKLHTIINKIINQLHDNLSDEEYIKEKLVKPVLIKQGIEPQDVNEIFKIQSIYDEIQKKPEIEKKRDILTIYAIALLIFLILFVFIIVAKVLKIPVKKVIMPSNIKNVTEKLFDKLHAAFKEKKVIKTALLVALTSMYILSLIVLIVLIYVVSAKIVLFIMNNVSYVVKERVKII